MQPNVTGLIVVALLFALLFTGQRVKWTWRFFVLSLLFAATSVAEITALGGSTLVVTHIGVIALAIAALFVVAPKDPSGTRSAFAIHGIGLMLIAYTMVISIFGPRLFAGQIEVASMKPVIVNGQTFAQQLGPTAANITHAAYLTGSFLTALATTILFNRKLTAADFRNAILAVAALHAAFGLIDAVGVALGQSRMLDFLRTANYAMLSQAIDGITRLSGTFTEPAAYAATCIPLAVFATEIWLRQRSRAAGLIALCVWGMMFASTSTTGIFGAAVYAIICVPRFMFSSEGGNGGRVMTATLIMAAAALGVTAYALIDPASFRHFADFVGSLTVDKASSQSANERTVWAMQGWETFKASFGLGTGAGSFRSSSFITAVLGSLGVIGSVLMLIFIAQVSRVAFLGGRRMDETRKAAGWAALMALVPYLVSGVTCDPGFVFGMFAGFALCPLRQDATSYDDEVELHASGFTATTQDVEEEAVG